ncbi:MAG: DMT family transporter [Phycisphaerales bacterium JB050]
MFVAAAPLMPLHTDAIIGGLAGLATSALWVATSLCFTSAGRRIGSTMVNALRLVVAIVLLAVTYRLLSGSWWPGMHQAQLLSLALSGLFGLTICDQALFTAFLDIGPRRALLMMTTSPIAASVLGWSVLGEPLGWIAGLGIAMTLAGIFWVILERSPSSAAGKADLTHNPHARRGIVLALIAAICQAIGFLLSKRGMGHGLEEVAIELGPQGATYVRMVFGGLFMLPIVLAYWLHRHSQNRHTARRKRIGSRRAGYAFTVMGAIVGPYLGVWMSLTAMDHIPLGIAQTLCSLSPVMILPVVALVYREHVNRRAILGAAIAVAGASVLITAPYLTEWLGLAPQASR